MSRARWIPLATVIAAVGGVAAGLPAGAIEPAGTGPTVPAGYVLLADDTQAIAVIVPATWTDIDTAPGIDDAGNSVPYIAAAPDLASFFDTFDTPGVQFMSFPFVADPQQLVDQYGLVSGCASLTVEPYADPVFTGVVQVGTGCGSGAATWKMVAASPASQARTVAVQVQSASAADQVAMDTVLASFDFVAGASTPTVPAQPTVAVPTVPGQTVAVPPTVAVPTVPGQTVAVPPTVAVATVPMQPTVAVPTVPGQTVAVPPTVAAATVVVQPTVAAATVPVTSAAATPSMTLTDDTGTVSVEVPATWVQTDTSPSENGRPFLFASPDMASFFSDDPVVARSVPAVLIRASTELIEPVGAIAFISTALAGDCTPKELQPYDDGMYTGSMQVFSDCAGTATFMAFIVASPPSQAGTVTVVIQALSIDDPAVSMILGSFGLVGA